MAAYERSVETSRPDALFRDAFAAELGGPRGRILSERHGAETCAAVGFPSWPAYRVAWTAARTKFVDDVILRHAADVRQVVHLAAGFETRPWRLDAYATLATFDVDAAVVLAEKAERLEDAGAGPPRGAVRAVAKDDDDLCTVLKAASFDDALPTLFVLEEAGHGDLFDAVTCPPAGAVSLTAPGSVLALQFDGAKTPRDFLAKELARLGWTDVKALRFGDPLLSYGRFPARFLPRDELSMIVARKL